MLTLPEAKLHLRVDGPDDDTYIEALVATATEYVQRMVTPARVDRTLPPVPPAVTDTQKHAVRLLVGHWYANREAATDVSLSEAPMAVRMLLSLNRPARSWL